MLSVLCHDKPGIWISCYQANCKSFLIAIKRKFLYVDFMARKPLSTKIEKDLQKEVKKLAIDLERPLNDLIEEAFEDLLKKYEKDTEQQADKSN